MRNRTYLAIVLMALCFSPAARAGSEVFEGDISNADKIIVITHSLTDWG